MGDLFKGTEIKVKVEIAEDSIVLLATALVLVGFGILGMWVVAKKM